MKKHNLTLSCIFIYFISFTNLNAQPIIPDSSFNGNGYKIYNPVNYGSSISGIVQQTDQKIVSVGSGSDVTGTFAIVSRFNLNGTPDLTFGSNGIEKVSFDSVITVGNKILLQPDGKIVVGGYTGANPTAFVGISRLNTDGSLDTSFSGTGKVKLDISPDDDILQALVIQPNRYIVAAGYSTNGTGTAGSFIVRLTPQGILDTTFNHTGKIVNPLYLIDYEQTNDIQLDNNGNIYICGGFYTGGSSRYFIKRINTNGIYDTTFANNGVLVDSLGPIDDIPTKLKIQLDGKLLVTGYSTFPIPGSIFAPSDIFLARYFSDGNIDSSFNFDGKRFLEVGLLSDVPTQICFDVDNNIYISAYSNLLATPSMFLTDFQMSLSKIDELGFIDSNFASNGSVFTSGYNAEFYPMDFLIQSDGKFLLAGHSPISSSNQIAIVRFTTPVTTGIHTLTNATSVNVYPNPFNNQVNFVTSITGNKTLEIYDITGKQIFIQEFENSISLSLLNLNKGYYFYKIIASNKIINTGKLMKLE